MSTPRAPWMEQLRRSGIDYRRIEVPNCRYKVDHALEISFNFYRPAKKWMVCMAAIFHKVEANIDALRAYERKAKGRSVPA